MRQAPTFHIGMGVDEARVMAVALGLLIDRTKKDLENDTDDSEQSRDNFFTILSTQLVAKGMHSSLWNMIEMTADMGKNDEDGDTSGQH
jgi:hypothetical protein